MTGDRPADFPAHRARSEGAANIIVIHDADVLEDRFWVRVQDFFGQQVATPFSDNGALIAELEAEYQELKAAKANLGADWR